MDMDRGRREVGEAAGVIEVEVGEQDVADILGAIAERLDLRDRGLCRIEPGSAMSPVPSPVSTSASPSARSISSTWQTRRARANRLPWPATSLLPSGHIVPVLR
jgi:hypothetical protein